MVKKTALNLTKMAFLVLCLAKMASLGLHLVRVIFLELYLDEKVRRFLTEAQTKMTFLVRRRRR